MKLKVFLCLWKGQKLIHCFKNATAPYFYTKVLKKLIFCVLMFSMKYAEKNLNSILLNDLQIIRILLLIHRVNFVV